MDTPPAANTQRTATIATPTMGDRKAFTSPKIGESSEESQKAAHHESAPLSMASIHTDPYDAMPPGPDGQIHQTNKPKTDLKGKGKEKARINDSDSDFRNDSLWQGTDNLDSSGYLTLFPPRWQSGSTSFIDRALE